MTTKSGQDPRIRFDPVVLSEAFSNDFRTLYV